MKRLSLVIVALLGLLVAVPTVQAVTTPFTGSWTSVDLDGSTQYLTISGGSDVHLTYGDDYGTVCANAGSPTTVFHGSMTGTISGNTLDAGFDSARCGPVSIDSLPISWTYDPATDTIFDGFVVWHRL